MGSRISDGPLPYHQPLLSSLVVRASESDGGGEGGIRGASDYEPGEVRREPLPYSRSDRYTDEPAMYLACKNLGLDGGSSSPVRRRDPDNRYGSDFDRSNGLPRSREFGGRRDPGRYRESSPAYGRGRIGGRQFGRGSDGFDLGPRPFRGGEGMGRNNPNVRPREGDWICPDPSCGNLNFARREQCNNCNRFKPGAIRSPRRVRPGPPPPLGPPKRFPGPPMVRSPIRPLNGHRSPSRGWGRDGPREYGGIQSRHDGRFPDPHVRRDRPDFAEDDYGGRSKFDRPVPMEWGSRDRGRDIIFSDRRGFERRLPSPPTPLPPHQGRWGRDIRERSRSPIRGGPPPKEYRRDMYIERAQVDRRGVGRDRIGDAY